MKIGYRTMTQEQALILLHKAENDKLGPRQYINFALAGEVAQAMENCPNDHIAALGSILQRVDSNEVGNEEDTADVAQWFAKNDLTI